MYYFVDAVCSIADIFFLFFLASSFFPQRSNRRGIMAVTYSLFGIILLLLSANPDMALIRTGFWIIGGSIFVWIIFNTKPLPSLFVGLSFLCIGGLAETAVMALLSFLGLKNQALLEVGSARVLYIIISHIAEFTLVIIVRFSKWVTTGRLSPKVLLPVCPCFAISILFCLLLGSDISKEANINPLYLVVAIGLLYTSIVIVFYTVSLQEHENARHSLELANHHYAMQKEYYEQFHSQQEQTRALWHDISKYLRAVEAESNTTESLAQFQEMVNSITPVVDVNNRVVSIILNEYVQIANDAETALDLDVQIPSDLSITAADMYIILGNTLDNALDACGELPEEDRKISFQLRLHNQMLFYRISNPYVQAHLKRKRSQFHGYGLKNVQECVKRNKGSMEVSTENNTYTVTVLMNCL